MRSAGWANAIELLRDSDVFPADPCRLWIGGVDRDGYGRLERGYVHRLAFVNAGGEIPEGFTIDHLCHDPALCEGGPKCHHRRCLNPRHMAAVSRGDNARRQANVNGRKTQCCKGHEFTPENTYIRQGVALRRECRTCRTAAQRARRHSTSATTPPAPRPEAGGVVGGTEGDSSGIRNAETARSGVGPSKLSRAS